MKKREAELADQRRKFSLIDEQAFDALVDDPGALQLYCLLAIHVYGDAGYKLGRPYMAERLGCSLNTLDRRMKKLVERRLVRVTHTSHNGGYGWNKYVLLEPSKGGSRTDAPTPMDGATPSPHVGAPSPHRWGLQQKKENRPKNETPLPPSGGDRRRTATCADCRKDGVVGVDVFRHSDSTAPYGKRTQYLHAGCKPRVQYGVQERISTSTEDKDWL